MLCPDINSQKKMQQNSTRYRTALYLRLSREDGDKTESDSIANQRTLLEAYAADHPELEAEQQNLQTAPNAYPFLDVYRKYRKLEEITRPMVVELIEKIEVYEGNRVEITFRFQDEIADLLEEQHQKQMGQHEASA